MTRRSFLSRIASACVVAAIGCELIKAEVFHYGYLSRERLNEMIGQIFRTGNRFGKTVLCGELFLAQLEKMNLTEGNEV